MFSRSKSQFLSSSTQISLKILRTLVKLKAIGKIGLLSLKNLTKNASWQVFEGLFAAAKSQGDAKKAGIENLMASLETLDEALGKVSGGLPFFGGEKMGFADVIFAPFFCCYPAIEAVGGFKFGFEEKYPRLHAWLKAFEKSSAASVLPDPEKVTEFVINRFGKES